MGISDGLTKQKWSSGASSLNWNSGKMRERNSGESHYEIGSIRDAEDAYSGTEALGTMAARQGEREEQVALLRSGSSIAVECGLESFRSVPE